MLYLLAVLYALSEVVWIQLHFNLVSASPADDRDSLARLAVHLVDKGDIADRLQPGEKATRFLVFEVHNHLQKLCELWRHLFLQRFVQLDELLMVWNYGCEVDVYILVSEITNTILGVAYEIVLSSKKAFVYVQCIP